MRFLVDQDIYQVVNAHCQAPMARGEGGLVGFEDLEVWQQAHQLTVEGYKLARQFPVAKASRAEPQRTAEIQE